MNPLERVSHDIHYLILQHLDAKDVLEASTISKSWNETVNTSSTCMRKIRFTMKFWKQAVGTKPAQVEEKIAILKASKRSYQNVSIVCRFDRNLSLEFWNFLKALKSSIIELKIKSIMLNKVPPIKFPKLEVLRLTYVLTNVRNVILVGCSTLKKLKLKMESPLKWKERVSLNPEQYVCIEGFLQRNKHLEELEIHGSQQYNSFFKQDFSSVIQFQLKSLKVKAGMRLVLISEENERAFMNFITTQSKSLQKISIDGCRSVVIQHIFNNMPALNSISIDVMIMDQFKVKELSLKLNENIYELTIPYVNEARDIEEFLSVVPNLRSLFISRLSHETMEFIARNMMHLKTLKFRCDELNAGIFYDQLRDDFPDVNQDIELIIDYDYI